LPNATPGANSTRALDDLAAGDTEIVPLKVGALCPRLLRRRHVPR